MKENKKELLIAFLISVVGCVYILGQILTKSILEKTIIDFLVMTTVIPAIVLMISGIVLGRKNKLGKNFPYLFILSTIVFAASIFSIIYLYQTGFVFEMLANTQTAENLVLEINDKVTVGTVVQQALICLVCVSLGNILGDKTVSVFNSIRN